MSLLYAFAASANTAEEGWLGETILHKITKCDTSPLCTAAQQSLIMPAGSRQHHDHHQPCRVVGTEYGRAIYLFVPPARKTIPNAKDARLHMSHRQGTFFPIGLTKSLQQKM